MTVERGAWYYVRSVQLGSSDDEDLHIVLSSALGPLNVMSVYALVQLRPHEVDCAIFVGRHTYVHCSEDWVGLRQCNAG